MEIRKAPNDTAALSFVANSEAARYVFVVVVVHDVMDRGRRYDTVVLACAREVVVGLAASPAASAPIGHAAPPAAGAKGRPRQSKARRGLASFLKFEVTILDQSDDASHNSQCCLTRIIVHSE